MKKILLVILMSVSVEAMAGVVIRNGAFYMNYTDLAFKGSKTEITRSYQSYNTSIGLFGYGWGSVMETRLFAFPDGTVAVIWWGGGNTDIFEPAVQDKQGLHRMINEITHDEIGRGKLENTPVALMKRKSELITDANKRIQKYIDLILKKKIPAWTPVSGRAKIWKRNVNQIMEWDGHAYLLKNWMNRYRFSHTGLITEITEMETRIQLAYTNERLSSIRTDDLHDCSVQTDSAGKITRIAFTDSLGLQEAVYRYDATGNLLYSKDIGKNEYWHTYDKTHNMTRIGYADSTFMEIVYDPVTYRTIRVSERNKSYKTYQYPFFYTAEGKINYLHYATSVNRYNADGLRLFSEYYEFESRTKPDGTDYLYHRIIKTDTSYDEAIYDANAGNAVYRKLNNKEAWQQYDGKERCSRLHMNDSIYISSYNKADLPELFIAIDSLNNDTVSYRYFYTTAGELNSVHRNDRRYTITGSAAGGRMVIKRDDIELTILFKNGIAEKVVHELWGTLQLTGSATEANSNMATYMAPDNVRRIKKTADTKALSMGKLPNGKTMSKPPDVRTITTLEAMRMELNAKKEHILRELYREFSDIIEPKLIAHEWIWDRM